MNELILKTGSTATPDYYGIADCSSATNVIEYQNMDFFNQCWLSYSIKKTTGYTARVFPSQFFDVDVMSDYPIVIITPNQETHDKPTFLEWTAGYIIKTDKVKDFVEKRTYLKDIIIRARNEIHKYFPEETLAIDVFSDPEEEHSRDELVIHIITERDPGVALKALDRFDENWWLDASLGIEDVLCVHLVAI